MIDLMFLQKKDGCIRKLSITTQSAWQHTVSRKRKAQNRETSSHISTVSSVLSALAFFRLVLIQRLGITLVFRLAKIVHIVSQFLPVKWV